MTIGALLLAAGQSRRFGSDKRYALLGDGDTVLQKTLATIRQADLPVLVCLGAGDERTAEMLRQGGIDSCYCDRSGSGIGATLAQGVVQQPVADWEGLLVCLADMPYIEPATLQRLVQELTPRTICAPVYKGRRGHPVGFGRSYFADLAALDGDQGARNVLRANPCAVSLVPVADSGVVRDIDEPGDLGKV